MNDRKFNSLEDTFVATTIFLTLSMLLIKWEWYIDIPYWIVFAPIYVPIIVALLVVFILSITEQNQNKND
jgi:uncharacterized membrane protein